MDDERSSRNKALSALCFGALSAGLSSWVFSLMMKPPVISAGVFPLLVFSIACIVKTIIELCGLVLILWGKRISKQVVALGLCSIVLVLYSVVMMVYALCL